MYYGFCLVPRSTVGEVTPPGSTNEDDFRLVDLDQPIAGNAGMLHVRCLKFMVHIFVLTAHCPAPWRRDMASLISLHNK